MNENKTAVYLVAIVGIVAAVGILLLIINQGTANTNMSGQAISSKAIEIRTNEMSLSLNIESASGGCCRREAGKCVCQRNSEGSCADC